MTIYIHSKTQTLSFIKNDTLVAQYPISTASNGLGEQKNSFKTPRGWHSIRAKIGKDLPLFSVFRARRATGEIFNNALYKHFPTRDWILTRILWLSGTEVGVNRLGHVDTMQRFIYIHGTHDEKNIGQPNSKGCIRMLNKDIAQLFDLVSTGDSVWIGEGEL